MRNGTRVLLATTVIIGAVLAAQHAPDFLQSVEFFRVEQVRLDGARFLDKAEAVEAAELPEDLSVWGDLEGVAARLRTHPLVEEARVRRRFPSTLVFQVREHDPVALLPTPELVPVDAEGRLLPIDPVLHHLDLPILRARTEAPDGGPGPGVPLGGEGLTLAQRRMLAGEVARLGTLEPGWAAALSEASLDAWGDVVIRLMEPAIAVRFRPPLTARRLRDGLQVLDDALRGGPGHFPEVLDLRFADQVVVRHHPITRR